MHALRGGVELDVQLGFHVPREKLAEPVRFNRRGQGKNGTDLLVARFNLADFSNDKERTVLHSAFARQHAAPAVNEFTTQRALVQPPRHTVAEPDENALLQRLILDFTRLGVETFSLGDAEKLIQQRPDLSRGDGVNAKLAAGVEVKLVLRRVCPRTHQNPEIGRGLVAQQIFAGGHHFAPDVAQQQIAALSERGHETGLMDAAVCLRRQQHARVTRMQRKGQHLAAGRGDL